MNWKPILYITIGILLCFGFIYSSNIAYNSIYAKGVNVGQNSIVKNMCIDKKPLFINETQAFVCVLVNTEQQNNQINQTGE